MASELVAAVRRCVNWLLPVGRRSLLWGVHQVFWHPITVALAWRRLYSAWPTWRETICIIVHDWGYWSAPNMDGAEGQRHPELGARIAGWLLGDEYRDLVLLHSRHYAKLAGKEPSPLCWADKLSITFEPWWWYLPRGILSGEVWEYRRLAVDSGHIPVDASVLEWFTFIKAHFARIGQQRFDAATAKGA